MTKLDEIVADFEFIDDWEERYRYLIELGRTLEPLAPQAHNDVNKVRGCASQVWLQTDLAVVDGQRVLRFTGDSDAHIVRGLVAVVIAMFSGRTPEAIIATDPEATFVKLSLREHLTPQRSNGVNSMIQRIKHDAQTVLAASTG
ncbi:MAG: SufE family protein [Ancalomicrobiaceae bacterium]|nr:SufE family protein [Ancalomicrobiaceae bacterium]